MNCKDNSRVIPANDNELATLFENDAIPLGTKGLLDSSRRVSYYPL